MTGQIIHQTKGNSMEIHKIHVTKPGCVENVIFSAVIDQRVTLPLRRQIDVNLTLN